MVPYIAVQRGPYLTQKRFLMGFHYVTFGFLLRCVDATLAFQPQVLKYSQHISENKQKYLENDPHNFIGTFTGIHATGTITLL